MPAAVDEGLGDGVVVAFRIFCGEVFGEDIVAGRGQSVGTHAAVVAMLEGLGVDALGMNCNGLEFLMNRKEEKMVILQNM